MKRKFWGRRIAGFIAIGIVAILLFSFIVMSLWNNILVSVLHISAITFWQALGILILAKILFGGFRGGWRGHHHGYPKKQMFEKWQNMTPEEREKFREEWESRCGRWRRPAQTEQQGGAE
jgi:hypothetical protein